MIFRSTNQRSQSKRWSVWLLTDYTRLKNGCGRFPTEPPQNLTSARCAEASMITVSKTELTECGEFQTVSEEELIEEINKFVETDDEFIEYKEGEK